MKRALTLVLSLATALGGLWMMTATHSLNSACVLSAQTGGGGSCVSGVPFYLTGLGLTVTGVACLVFTQVSSLRAMLDRSRRAEIAAIAVLVQHETESLRDVA